MADTAQNAVESAAPNARLEAPFWRAPWEFAVHGVVGTLIFSIIAAFAVALDFSVQRLVAASVSGVIIFGLKAAEYALFATDFYLFCVFLWKTARRTAKIL